MRVLPKALEDLIEALGSLPGVGPRSAERYAYYLLKHGVNDSQKLAEVLSSLHGNVDYCPKTFALIEKGQEYSELYTDPRRNKKLVAVVADPFDIIAIEKTGNYSGTYHVLGGLVSPIDGITPDQLRIKELVRRVDDDEVEELVLATNASVEGESTALILQQELGNRTVKLTRIAHGLPIGVDLEYADQITLTRALEGRQAL